MQAYKKISIISVTLAGLLLTGFTMIKISVLGFEINERSTFPLLNAAREISVANFIERLDAVVVFVMMMGIYVKVSIFFYCALRGIGYVSKLHYRPFVIPVAMQIAMFAILIAANTTEHFHEGFHLVPLYIHLPIQYIIPFLIFLFIICKNIKKEVLPKMLFKKLFKSKIRKIDPWIPTQESRNIKIGKDLKANQNHFQEIFGHTSDFYIESLYIGQREALICYLTTMTDEQAINDKIVLSFCRFR